MGYLNEDGLARYDGLIKNWTTFKSGTVDGVDPLLNWQRTDTTGAVTFYPLPAAPIDPVVNFQFTETGPAEGEKGPDNPSTITGVSSITVTRCETVGVDSTDYTIDLGDTYFGGSVDLSAGTMMVTWEMFTLNGNENWSIIGETATAGIYSYSLKHGFVADGGTTGNGATCSHFMYNNGAVTQIVSWHHSKNYLYIYSDISSLESFKAWLTSQSNANAPVTICDKKVTTLSLSLPPLQIYSLSQADTYTPRLNTVYSDQTSVQVGYPKSPLATTAELTNAIISLGGNV